MNNKPEIIWNINLWGWSDSELQWVANSVSETECLDIHSEPWLIKVNQALKKVGNTDALVVSFVPCSDGNTYAFSSNGKVYKKTPTELELMTTIWYSILDALEFNGFIYFTGTSNLWQVAVPAAWSVDWSSKNETFWSYINADTIYHPLHHQNLILYIGDWNLVAQVDSTTGTHVYTADALDLQKQYRITTLGKYDNDLVIGATVKWDRSLSEIFRWNTWSVSYTTSDPVPESSINAIFSIDNMTVVQAGEKGNIYSYDGYQLNKIKRIPWDWSANNGAIVHRNANINFNGLPLFWLSNITGDPVKQGIYSFWSWSSTYPTVLNHEYTISENKKNWVTIWAMVALRHTFLVSWSVDGIHWIDEIDWNSKASTAFFKTRKIQLPRLSISNLSAKVAYRKAPNDISILSIENDTQMRSLDLVRDMKRKIFSSNKSAIEASSLQIKVELHGEWNSAPEIEYLIIE